MNLLRYWERVRGEQRRQEQALRAAEVRVARMIQQQFFERLYGVARNCTEQDPPEKDPGEATPQIK